MSFDEFLWVLSDSGDYDDYNDYNDHDDYDDYDNYDNHDDHNILKQCLNDPLNNPLTAPNNNSRSRHLTPPSIRRRQTSPGRARPLRVINNMSEY